LESPQDSAKTCEGKKDMLRAFGNVNIFENHLKTYIYIYALVVVVVSVVVVGVVMVVLWGG
jgi:hypothetical protein